MRMTKRKKIVLICLGAFIVWQVGTYLLFASSSIPHIAPHLTPEHTHFAEGTTFSWIWLQADRAKNLTMKQIADLRSILKNHYDHVYGAEAEIPESRIHRNPNGDWTGYGDGFSFSFSVVSDGPFWVRVSHSDSVGNESASFGEHVYIWVLGVWVKLYDGPMAVT